MFRQTRGFTNVAALLPSRRASRERGGKAPSKWQTKNEVSLGKRHAMAAVLPPQWAGTFDCAGPCGRKRLLGSDFSEKARARGAPFTCLRCATAAAAAERAAAAPAAAAAGAGAGAEGGETRACAACARELPLASFSKTQAAKGAAARCAPCLDSAAAAEAGAARAKLLADLEEARAAARAAEKSGSAADRLRTSMLEAALESQLVTGVKPRAAGGGGSGGGGRGRGRGR